MAKRALSERRLLIIGPPFLLFISIPPVLLRASTLSTVVMAAHESGNAASGARDSLDSEADSQHSTARFDQETLSTEEEAERLLMGVQGQRKSKSKRRKGKQEKWRGSRDGDASELMLKIEDGGRSSDDSANSSDVDAREIKNLKVCVESFVFVQSTLTRAST